MDNHIPCHSYEYQKYYMKRYQETHRERLSAIRNRKIMCNCGTIISLSSLYNHLNTKKHKKNSTEISPLYVSC
jgi:hypothetical protein